MSIDYSKIDEKEYPDEGKHAAPRWLAFPSYDPYTIGWRMGAGEDYVMNEPMRDRQFGKLFPRPKIWLFNPRKANAKGIPLMGFMWEDNGKPKYDKITGDTVEVNDFITVDQTGSEFYYNAIKLKSIEYAVLLSKFSYFAKIWDVYHVDYDLLKRGFELTEEEIAQWDDVKYSVLLNAAYYLFMQDDNLKQKLLSTGDKSLVYASDDEWGGDDNLFGFALMELRDEIRRICANENLIDWQYTKYLINKDPYENYQARDPEDQQSPEYMVVLSTLNSSKYYARDINLKDGFGDKYREGQVVTERAFVDATDKIGGLATNHRYLILSNQMKDISEFEHGTNWNLHVTNRNSRFRVLDVYEKNAKTQILLLQLPDGFEEVFENRISIIKEAIDEARTLFDRCLEEDPIAEVSNPEWLERMNFPIGMDDEGNFW